MLGLFWTFVVVFGLSACFGWPIEIKKSYWMIPIVANFVFAEVAALVIVALWNFIEDYPYYPYN